MHSGVRRLEHIAPAARSSALGEPFSAALQRSRHEHVERALQDLEPRSGVSSTRPVADRALLADALYRRVELAGVVQPADDLGLDVDAAAAILRRQLGRLLGA